MSNSPTEEALTAGRCSFRCDLCSYYTNIKGNLRIHMQTDKHIHTVREMLRNVKEDGPEKSETRIRRCDLCGLETTTLYDQLTHYEQHYIQFVRNDESPPGGEDSPRKVDSGYQDQSSGDDSPDGGMGAAICPICHENYRYQATLEIHIRQEHGSLARSPSTVQPEYHCDACNYRTTSKHNLHIHFNSARHELNCNDNSDLPPLQQLQHHVHEAAGGVEQFGAMGPMENSKCLNCFTVILSLMSLYIICI